MRRGCHGACAYEQALDSKGHRRHTAGMHLTWWVTRAKTTICCRLRHICSCCCCPGGRTSGAASCTPAAEAPDWLTAVHRPDYCR